jgi:hypothetical protein
VPESLKILKETKEENRYLKVVQLPGTDPTQRVKNTERGGELKIKRCQMNRTNGHPIAAFAATHF